MAMSIRAALSGRYVIERELGRGGFACVYQARDLKHSRKVALKVVTADVSSTLVAERFLREIRTTAALNHPHILPLFDSGTADGLVYFTMPYVGGESLRNRLDRQTMLEPDVALKIARQLADALAYAHGEGIVHRDLKPENVLLGPGDHVWIADFGLCRALSSATDHRLSGTGLVLGSPAYISPEQAAGEEEIGARSDIYSFGCLTFEMLTGEPPFTDKSVASLLAKHLSAPAPSARDRHPGVTAAADAALRRAMARQPADRFADARDFVQELASEARPASQPVAAIRGAHAWGTVVAGAAVIVALLLLLSYRDRLSVTSLLGADAPLDTTRFAVLPLEQHGVTATYAQHRLRESLSYWNGITVVDQFQVEDAVASAGGVSSLRAAHRIAEGLGAGRMLRGSVSLENDSLLIYAALFDVNRGSTIQEAMVRMHVSERQMEPYFDRLTDALLFPEVTEPRSHGTHSRAALHAYGAGHEAIEEWHLVRADSLFTAAATYDADYARALLWLAQVRMWLGQMRAEWVHPAERAASVADELPEREQTLLAGLLSMGKGEYPEACVTYGRLVSTQPLDFAAVLGLAECHRRDPVVVRDRESPTGWSFRSSGNRAVLQYQRAFQLLPATHRGFRSGGFQRLRNEIFFTAPTASRAGRNAEGEMFSASPAWEDTLVFYPVQIDEIKAGYWSTGPSTETAIRELRRILFDVTTVWVRAYPQSADALEARAIAMELLGDAGALPTLREARALAVTSEHRLNLEISEFWLQVKRALPTDTAELRSARLLADSILSQVAEEPHTAERMAAVAAATGRVHHAARLSRAAAAPGSYAGVAQSAAALLAFAAMGGPADSMVALEETVSRAITNTLTPAEAGAARDEHLCRAATLAFPNHRMAISGRIDCAGDFLNAAQAAYVQGDAAAARARLDALAVTREALPAADIQFENLLPEAWLLLQMNDPAAARQRIDPTLDAVRFIEPGGLERVAAAGAFARVLLLRADIAHALHDPSTAHQWAAAFIQLWKDADAEMRPLVQHAARFTGH